MYALLLPTIRFKETSECSFSDKLLLCVREEDKMCQLKTKNESMCLPEWVECSGKRVLTYSLFSS